MSSSSRALNRSYAHACTTLDELTPSTRNWFIKVLVVEKTPIRSLIWGRHQKLVLLDQEKGNMQCIIYDPDVDQLNKVIELYKTYYIGNGRIKELAANATNMAASNYQITLNRSSYIKRVNAQEELPLDHIYELTSFAECSQFADSPNKRINLLCGVIHVFPPRFIEKNKRTLQDFVIINEERKPTIFTVWEDFVKSEALDLTENIATMPVVLGMRLSVNTFHGVSVGTLPHSSILFAPPIPQAAQLKLWLNNNKDYVDVVITQRLYEKGNQNIEQPHATQIRKIHQILSLDETVKSFWVKANVEITNSDQCLYFLACPNCSKACGAPYNTKFTCFYCENEFPTSTPRLKFEVDLFDGTGSLHAFVEQREAQMLLCMSADRVMELEAEGNQPTTFDINERLSSTQFLFHVRTSTYEVRSKKYVRNMIMACLTPSEPQLTFEASHMTTSKTTQEKQASDVAMVETEQPTLTTDDNLSQRPHAEQKPKSTGKRGLTPTPDVKHKGQKFTKQD